MAETSSRPARRTLSCLPRWFSRRQDRFCRRKRDDSLASVSEEEVSCEARCTEDPPERALSTPPAYQPRSDLACGQATRNLFRATTVRGHSTRGLPVAKRDLFERRALAKSLATRPGGRAGSRSERTDTEDEPPRQASAPAATSFCAASMRKSSCRPSLSSYRVPPKNVGESSLCTVVSTSPSRSGLGDEAEHVPTVPSTVKIRFGRLYDVPVTKEGDSVDQRSFYCYVYFNNENPDSAAADARRCTQPKKGYYSGCTRYEVPLEGEVLEIAVPQRNTDGTSNTKKEQNSTRDSRDTAADATKGMAGPREKSSDVQTPAEGDLKSKTVTGSHGDSAEQSTAAGEVSGGKEFVEEGSEAGRRPSEGVSPASRDQAVSGEAAAVSNAQQGERVGDVPASGGGVTRSGAGSVPANNNAPVLGFHIGVVEELRQGGAKTGKGSTVLLKFDDPRLLEPRKWPMKNDASGSRTAAGSVYFRCQLVYPTSASGTSAGESRSAGAVHLEKGIGAEPDLASADASPSGAVLKSADSPTTAADLDSSASGWSQGDEATSG